MSEIRRIGYRVGWRGHRGAAPFFVTSERTLGQGYSETSSDSKYAHGRETCVRRDLASHECATVTLMVDAAVRLPRSETFTQ
jgi:endonuclease III